MRKIGQIEGGKLKTYAYLRISTDKQDEASQRQIIAGKYSDGLEFVSDTASGGSPWQGRAIAGILERCASGDRIVVSEISRIARSTVGVLTFMQEAAAKGVTVDAVKSGICLDGSTASKIVITVLAMAAEIERDLLRERTKAALDARKARGLAVGRQVGAKGKSNKLEGKKSEIEGLLKAGVSKSAIARVLGVSRQTIHTFINTNNTNKGAA